MVKINTNLGVNVSLENAPTPQPIMNVGREQIVGKDKFEALADTLASINPKIKTLADAELKKRNEASFEEGRAKINGMTLEEAREAHKTGFPDVFNGWARYGAYKQYAINSTDNFIQEFKNDYWTKRNEAGYNWQDHYNEFSQQYLADKQGDEFFTSAYNTGTEELRKWLNVKEFEKQQEDLQYRVIGNTSLSIQNLPTKVEEQLEIAFYDANPPMTLGKDYQERKAKFFQENMSKTFKDMFYKLKENRNPSLSLADFDDVVINEAELHSKLDGRFASEYIELLTTNRPDGTPAIINNPKYQDRVTKLVEDLRDAVNLNVNTQNWFVGNVGSMSKKDRKDLANDIFDKEFRIKKAEGLSDADAFLSATLTIMPGMKRNEPVPQITELLQKPLTREYTEDNKLALEVYAALDKNGITGIYFDENDKNKYHYFVANLRVQAGEDPRDVIRDMGTRLTTTSEFNELSSTDKQTLQNSIDGNMANARNQELVYMTAQYFKNIAGGTNQDYLGQAKQFLQKHYSNINGNLVSKYKMNQFGVTEEQYDGFKVTAIEELKEILNKDKTRIAETDLIGFAFDETNIDVGEALSRNKEEGIDISNYELIIDTDDDVIYFSENGSMMPATVEYKNGETVWLQMPLKTVKDKYLAKVKEAQEKQDAKDRADLERKRKAKEASDKLIEETKDMIP